MEFELQIGRFAEKVKARADLVVRKVSLDLFRRIVLRTPVDTGRARGNWQVAIGSVPRGTLELDDKIGTATINKAQAVIAGVKMGDTVYFANSLPYIRALEFGHSKQSPQGMVRLSVAEFQKLVNAAVEELPDA